MLKLFIFCFCFILSFTSLHAEDSVTIPEFLHTSKQKYANVISSPQNLQEIHFVMGNESADLDSIVSSITFAYLLNQENSTDQDQFYIPLLNIYREELALRKDILYLFNLLHISTDDLLFLDDQVPLDTLFEQDKLRFTLVDHNALRPRQEHLSNAVERIVDHHVDENKNYPLLKPENKTIDVVGSAATLIAEKMLANDQVVITPELATLLLGPILVDTTNLKSPEKTTERDIHAVESLKPLAAEMIPQDFYEKLINAKNDVSGLTPAMLLSKDFKEYLDGEFLYGISSLPSSVTWWSEDEETIAPVLENYAKSRKLSFLILLMANNDPQGPKRKIIVYSPSANLLNAFDAYVQKDKELSNILISGPTSNTGTGLMNFYLSEKFIARKQLQPLFHFSQAPDLIGALEREKALKP